MIEVPALAARVTGLRHDEAVDLVVAVARPEPDALAALVEAAAAGLSDDPGAAADLLEVYLVAADELGLDAIGARAQYLRAQASAMAGLLAEALVGIERSRVGFERAGLPGAALRTNLGRANVLHALGRSPDALTACDAIVAVASRGGLVDLDPHEAAALLAAAHQNRGLCLELGGRYPEALAAYALAETGFRQIDAVRPLGEVLNDRGLLLLAMGRVTEAVRALDAAADVSAAGGFRSLHATFLCSRAEAELLQGAYAGCLETLAAAREVFAQIDSPVHEHDRSLVAGRAYEALNLWPEAAATYRDAADFFASAEMVLDEAQARWGLARINLADGHRTGTAELDAAVELFRRADHPQWLAAALLDRARLDHRIGDSIAAASAVAEALELSVSAGSPVETVRARLLLAALAAERGDATSDHHLAEARLVATSLGVAPLEIAVDRAAGLQWLAAGRVDLARPLLERALDGIERLQGSLTHDAIATMFLADKLDAHGALVELDLRAGDAGRALETVERARSRVLTELAAGRVASSSAGAGTDALEHELNAVYNELFSPSDRGAEQLELIRRRAVELELQISTNRLDLIASALPAPTSPAPERAALPAVKVPILSWYEIGDDIVAFVADDTGVRADRLVGARPRAGQLVAELAVHHDRVRTGGAVAVRHADRLERACRHTLHALYELLVAPVEAWLPASDDAAAPLVVVPHGALHAVPFHALHDGDRYLVERFVVSYAPNVGVATRPAVADRPGARRAVVAAVDDELAPGTLAEAHAVAECFSDVALLTGASATADAVTRLLPGAGVVHLACHAMFRADNPMFSSLRFADRWLGARELGALDLRDAIVTLSTCDSARGLAVGGDELLGLVRAVLGAGAATMVASLWPADDDATAAVMTDLYGALDTVGPATALRAAQLRQLARTPHPYFWAPFTVIGAR